MVSVTVKFKDSETTLTMYSESPRGAIGYVGDALLNPEIFSENNLAIEEVVIDPDAEQPS